MAIQLQQINSEGQALQSGLDVFVSIPVYSGDYLAYGDSFITRDLAYSTDTTTSIDAYAAQAISLTPPSNINQWYLYHTGGTIFGEINAPSSGTNVLIMEGQKSSEALLESHSGMYQKLSGLVTGNEYQVTINFHRDNNNYAGTLSFSRFYYANENFNTALQTPVKSYSLPTHQITFSFTANSICDIVFFDYSTTETKGEAVISSIKIQEKNIYQIPTTTVVNDNMCKVLRRKFGEFLIEDE